MVPAGGEEGRAMLNVVLTIGGWLALAAVVGFWIRWSEREREVFGNGNGRWLE
jgi:hypothetical protein